MAVQSAAYQYLKSMLDNIADPIFVKDKEHRWVDGNRAFWELMGGAPETFLGKTDYDFFPKAEADVFWQKDNEVFQSRQTVINEEYLTDRNGVQHVISTKKTLFLNEHGQEVLVGIVRDITKEKELDRLKSQMAADAVQQKEQQRRMFETALSNTADSNYVFDLEGRFIYINKALHNPTGATQTSFIGHNFLELGYPPELAARMQDQLQHVINTKETLRDETPYVRGAGMRAYEYIFKPVIGENGVVEAVAGSTRDITDFKEANRRKDEFLAMLAHELRNPLAPISNAMHVMKSSGNEKIREEAAQLVDRQIIHMTHLLNDLLDVSRVTLGKIQLRPQRVSLRDIITMAAESVQPLIAEKGQTLEIAIPENPIWLNADPTRLSQVFSNLLNNAAKYTQNAGQIHITAEEDKLGLTIHIRDNGIGIPSEMQPHIFELFAQADSSMERSYGGLGIGLTLVKSLVEMHKGTVSVTSEGKGKGSLFTIRLPIQFAPQAETTAEKTEAPSGAHHRILIVDDNEASAKTLGWTLEILGHDIRLAHDGQQALSIAENYKPNVVLLDIGLPGMNGYEICRALRQNPALANTAIIAQTGWSQKEHRDRSKEAGFDHHLVKPIHMETLQELLQQLEKSGRLASTSIREAS